jgi:MATE family multidrug resistance protein
VLTPIAGHHYGAGRWREIGHTQVQGQWLAMALSLIGIVALLIPGPWLALAGADPAVADITARYLGWIALGLPAALMTRVYVGINAAVSRPGVAMTINLALLAAKVPLNALFLHGAGPLPAMGGAGCAAASAVLLWVGAVLNIVVWRLDPFYQRFRIDALTRPAWRRQKEILRLGLPSGLSLLIEVTSFTFMAILIARLGAATLAGHHIIANLVSLLFMLPLSLGIATSVLVAQSLGAGRPDLARRVALRGWRIAAGTGLALALAVWLGREAIVGGYTTDAEVARLALSLMGIAALFHAADALQGCAGQILRGYKIVLLPMLIHSAALWGVGLIGGFVLAYRTSLGAELGGAQSFWLAALAGLVLTAIALSALAERVSRDARPPRAHASVVK